MGSLAIKQPVIDSREVAEMMEMQHKDLLKKIDNINKDFDEENKKIGGEKIRYEKYWTESIFKNKRIFY